mmetsp:Transcript_95121/g.307989  ORF Transcript_95121/g.307989 Transcript_95121/m.307989 type:complete len:108 (+) Transcript_95121:80-403(+)
MGAVPVWFDVAPGAAFELAYGVAQRPHLPWTPLLNWSAFSVRFTLSQAELRGAKNYWPRLEAHLRSLVSSGRAVELSAGVAAVRHRFEWTESGIVRNLMELLALRSM